MGYEGNWGDCDEGVVDDPEGFEYPFGSYERDEGPEIVL